MWSNVCVDDQPEIPPLDQTTINPKSFLAAVLLPNRVQTTMNQAGQASGGGSGGGGFLPAPRQDMEYICAGVFVISTHVFSVSPTRRDRLWRKE